MHKRCWKGAEGEERATQREALHIVWWQPKTLRGGNAGHRVVARTAGKGERQRATERESLHVLWRQHTVLCGGPPQVYRQARVCKDGQNAFYAQACRDGKDGIESGIETLHWRVKTLRTDDF